MSELQFLAHSQLHEVLFAYLATADILRYRCVHSECDAVVIHFVETQLQDVLGQDYPGALSIGHKDADVVPRILDAHL